MQLKFSVIRLSSLLSVLAIALLCFACWVSCKVEHPVVDNAAAGVPKASNEDAKGKVEPYLISFQDNAKIRTLMT